MRDDKMFSHIWSSYTIKAFCKLCDHFDIVEEGDFLKLVQHLESHRTALMKEEVTEFKNENINDCSDEFPILFEEKPLVIPILKSVENESHNGAKINKSQKKKTDANMPQLNADSYERNGLLKRRKVRKTERKVRKTRRPKSEWQFVDGFESSDGEGESEGGEELAEINWATVWKEIRFPWDRIWDYWDLDDSRNVWMCKFCNHEYEEKECYKSVKKSKQGYLKGIFKEHTQKFHFDSISVQERESLISAKRKKGMVYRKIRKDYNLSRKGPVVDPDTKETMHIRKFMLKLYRKRPKKEESDFSSILKNFTKDLSIDANNYTCNLCKDTVTITLNWGKLQTENLFEHMQNIHGLYKDVQRHLCQDCGKVYMSESSLSLHVKIKHTKFKYFCPFEDCKKGFNIKGEQMEEHIRTHTGEKPHLCTICGEGFKNKHILKRHVDMHKGESKFVCKYCQKQFRENNQLQNHERTHTGERPFKCEQCGKCFVQKAHLVTHIRGVHKR